MLYRLTNASYDYSLFIAIQLRAGSRGYFMTDIPSSVPVQLFNEKLYGPNDRYDMRFSLQFQDGVYFDFFDPVI